MHTRPIADQFIAEARKLRGRGASEDEVIGAARVLYPTTSRGRDVSMRSRLLRAVRASAAAFAEAERVYKSGGDIGDIVRALPRNSAAGAPTGNLNSLGNKRDTSLARLNGMWRAMSREA